MKSFSSNSGKNIMGVLVTAGCPCKICGCPLTEDDLVFNFTFVGLTDERFVALDDSAVHKECLENWELREEFIAAWNREARQSLGPTWILTEQVDGTLSWGKEPAWYNILGILLFPIVLPTLWWCGLKKRLKWGYRYVTNRDVLTGRKRGPKCKFCGTRLHTPNTRQCVDCGMDWHDPENVICHRAQFS